LPTSAYFIRAFGWYGARRAWAALHLLVRLSEPPPGAKGSHACGGEGHRGASARRRSWTMIVLTGGKRRDSVVRFEST
jgi:hypothetical protein